MNPHVTAIVVAHDGQIWIPRLLRSLTAQDRCPDRVVAVDTGSVDDSLALLEQGFGPHCVLGAARDTGYGDSIRLGLSHADSAGAAVPAGAPVLEWVWLIHDDSAPAPGALDALLDIARRLPDAGVIGCKLLGWSNRRRLLSVGVTISGTGHRETGLERRELDQGQHDTVRDVLAVESAGMLVRRDVWDQLGGFDAQLPLYRDDVDFCWRAVRAGHRVVVCPAAVVYHAEASFHGARRVDATWRRPHRADRRSALYTLLFNVEAARLPWTVLRLLGGSLLRAAGFLLAKSPRLAGDEVVALFAVLGHPGRLRTGRRQRRLSADPGSRQAARSLLPPWWLPYRRGVSSFAELVGSTASERTMPRRSLTDSVLRTPIVPVLLVLLATAAVAARHLLGSGVLQGGALLPAPDGSADWWDAYLATWHPIGLGSDTVAPPYLPVLALCSAPLLGKAWLLVDVLFLLAVPLAASTAYLCTRRWVSHPLIRVWAAVAYGLLPVLTGAVAQGRLGTVVGTIVLPLAVRSVVLLLSDRPTDPPWRRGALAGLWLSVLTAFVPAAFIVAVAFAVVAGLTLRRTGAPAGTVIVRLSIMLVVPGVVLLPWSWSLLTDSSLWWGEAGMTYAGVGTQVSGPDLVVGHLADGSAAPAWVTVGIVLGGLAALVRRDRRRPILLITAGGLLGLVLGVAQFRHQASVEATGATVPGWPGFAVTLMLGACVAAAAVAADGARVRLARASFGWRQPLAVLIVAAAAFAPVVGLVWWLYAAYPGPLTREAALPLPAYIVAAQESPARPRTLVITTGEAGEGQVSYQLVRDDGPRLGDDALAPSSSSYGDLGVLVGRLVSEPIPADIAALTDYGIGYVVVQAPADVQVTDRLDAVFGLARTTVGTDQPAVWRLVYPAGRAYLGRSVDATARRSVLTGSATEIDSAVAGARSPRVAVLNERASTRWRATVDGSELAATPTGDWRPAYAVARDGGQLRIQPINGSRPWWLLVEAMAFVAVVVMASPGGSRERRGAHR